MFQIQTPLAETQLQDLLNFKHQETDLSGNAAIIRSGKFKGDHLQIEILKTASGDLNKDNLIDGVAVCWINSGGSGNFRQLALLINTGKDMIHVDSAHLGDRIRMKSIKIIKGVITAEYHDRGTTDSMAANPYLLKSASFQVSENKLKKLSKPGSEQ